MPGFRPAAEILFFREKDPKPLTPSSASLDWADAGIGRARQLTESVLSLVGGLKQGPPMIEERPPIGSNSRRRFEGKGKENSMGCGIAIRIPLSASLISTPEGQFAVALPDLPQDHFI